jgi:hypothetical protein
MNQIIVVAVLTSVIHLIDTLFYGVRLAGVRTRRLATAFSLYQVISLVAMTANMIQAPLLSATMERGINSGMAAYRYYLTNLQQDIRLIILAASLGTLAAALLTPLFILIFKRTIFLFERIGSLPQLVLFLFSPRQLWRVCREFASLSRRRRILQHSYPHGKRLLSYGRRGGFPLRLFLTNIFVIGIWTTGVLSALYAGALLPDFRSTASLLSGIVNGIAVVLSAFLVDPVTAMITDQTLQGMRDEREVTQLTFWLILSRLLGTVFAQAIFLPAVKLVSLVTMILTGTAIR